MPEMRFIDSDFAKLACDDGRKPESSLLSFGDKVEILEEQDGKVRVRAIEWMEGDRTGWLKKPKFRTTGILRMSMVDVQQGDGMVLELPDGGIVLIDGGDNKLFARHVAARFRHRRSAPGDRLPIEAMIITHGDADHFEGLNEFLKTETNELLEPRKRI
jgi:beta-lactamase superfamily II metal-dependent hydrolase